MIDWLRVKEFVARRAFFCAVATWDEGTGIRLFPIGSLRVNARGEATYFEIFARPVREGSPVVFLAVDANPIFWLISLLRGRFSHPPALRLRGTLGHQRPATESERQGWFRRVGLFLKTRGGRALWSNPKRIREVHLGHAESVRLGPMTRGLENWV